jgi:hypothetical protein
LCPLEHLKGKKCQCPEMKTSSSLGFSIDAQMNFLFGIINATMLLAWLFFRIGRSCFVHLASPA